MADIAPERLIFIGGLHRSGTTPLGRVLVGHPDVSGFTDTGAIEDEGQHLQQVYRPAQRFGGTGRFARAEGAHLGPVEGEEAGRLRHRLLAAWSPHWDLSRPFLVEKSPPNLIMGRYLQSVFPGSALVIILRHPAIVALSSKKWRRWTSLHRRTSLYRLVEHWFVAHDRLRADGPHLERLHLLRYEDLIEDPIAVLGSLADFLGLEPAPNADLIQSSRSERYVTTWNQLATGSRVDRWQRHRIESAFADRAAEYGYDLSDLTSLATSWVGNPQ